MSPLLILFAVVLVGECLLESGAADKITRVSVLMLGDNWAAVSMITLASIMVP